MANSYQTLHPLNVLLKADKTWEWSTACEAAFTEAKKVLASAPVLAHYNPALSIHLAEDASHIWDWGGHISCVARWYGTSCGLHQLLNSFLLSLEI